MPIICMGTCLYWKIFGVTISNGSNRCKMAEFGLNKSTKEIYKRSLKQSFCTSKHTSHYYKFVIKLQFTLKLK